MPTSSLAQATQREGMVIFMANNLLTEQQIKHAQRNNIVKGTLILTLAGFVTRFIGFFYRIYLSNTMGAELMGIYQLIFPVYAICFTIFAAGIQTSISRLVAAEMGKRNPKNVFKILRIGTIISVVVATLLSVLLYMNADFVAYRFLLERRSVDSIRILAVAFPFCGVTSCINGYYYGLKKAGVPAVTQLLEQAVRVIVVYIAALYFGGGNVKVTCEMAVFGLVIGELSSSLYNIISLMLSKSPSGLILQGPDPNAAPSPRKKIIKDILALSIPLSANRLLLSILHSIEAILIPAMLRRSGLSTQEALAAFGILNGMSIPFILFPTALINAFAVLVLPTVSEAQALNNDSLIGKTTAISIKYSLIVGIISTGIFIAFGRDLGYSVFHNKAAGDYLMILAWLCPLIYLTTTLSSIINGLGKAHISFVYSVIGTIAKIILIILLIPTRGITGYLIALLIGQLIITALDCYIVIRNVSFDLDSINSIVKPGIVVAGVSFLVNQCYDYFKKMIHINEVVLLLFTCFLLCIICLGFLLMLGSITKKDFK